MGYKNSGLLFLYSPAFDFQKCFIFISEIIQESSIYESVKDNRICDTDFELYGD